LGSDGSAREFAYNKNNATGGIDSRFENIE